MTSSVTHERVVQIRNKFGLHARPAAEFVKLGAARGDQVAIESGVKPGDEVVTSGVFKLRNGAAVQINNSVRPANSAAPKPQEG